VTSSLILKNRERGLFILKSSGALVGRPTGNYEEVSKMSMVKVTLKDGSVREYEGGYQPAGGGQIPEPEARQARPCLAVVNGVNEDLTEKLHADASVEFVTPDTKEGLHAIRHTASHVMAQAIQHLFPDVKFAIGPAIENGFYYDLDSEHVFTPEDLRAIEKEMAKIVKQNIPLVRSELPRAEALKKFERRR
jgi:threonyl-tRNA synthetase